MIRYPHLSIAGKLRWMILLAVIVVVTLVSLSHVAHTVYAHRASTLQRVAGVAELIALSSRAAIVFEDAAVANELLGALQADQDIVYAQVILPTADAFATYVRPGTRPADLENVPVPQGGNNAWHFTASLLQFSAPVLIDGELLGGVYIEASLSAMYDQLRASAAISLVIALLAIGLAVLISTRLQRVISYPIRRLVAAMERVSDQGDFGARVQKDSDDEIGVLIDGFNDMLAQINARDDRLADQRRSLEKLVAERTRDLSEANNDLQVAVDELHEAKVTAEQANLAKGEFLARMSHEIRTPMNGVLGMSELLHTTPMTPRQRQYATTIRRSTESLLAVVNDILDFSKIEANRLELETLEFALPDLVEEVAELLAEPAHAKDIELVCHVAESVPQRVVGDPTRLRQVLINLAGNAIKFTERGEVMLDVRYRGSTPRGEMLHFAIRDTGIGIAEEDRDRLFESFEQAANYTTRKYGGTGLGLAISRELVRAMGGNIRVVSAPGLGSEFSFDLDFTPGTAAGDGCGDDSLAGRHILVVDDNGTNREILSGQLESAGAAAACFERGEDALALLGTVATLDAAIIDCNMPGMDGHELARRIRALPAHAAMPVLMLSSVGRYDRPATVTGADEVDAYLCKPARRRHLLDLLAQLVAGNNPQDERQSAEVEYEAMSLGLNVLVAEDQLVNQSVVAGLLETLGCRYRIAENGKQALGLLADERFDLVLMDCQMPVMDGYAATRAIRGGERAGERLPVIALTANATLADREACEQAGMDDFLSKPFSRASLAILLSRFAGDERRFPVEAEPSSPAAGDEVLDMQALAKIRTLSTAANPGAFERIINGFFESMPPQVAALRDALACNDGERLWRIAHGMKSSCANLGALRLSLLLKTVEQAGKRADLVEAAALLASIEAEFSRVRDALRLQLTGEVA